MEFKRGGEHRVVTVSERTIVDCKAWAAKVVHKHGFRNPHRIDKDGIDDTDAHALGKICEAGFADMMGLSTSFIVRDRGGDGHKDFFIKMNNKLFTVDVKGSASPRAERLVWPKGAPFAHCADILVFARARPMDDPKFGQVWVPGFVMRDQFKRLHQEAQNDDVRGMVPGTWFMHWRDLTPIEILYAASRTCRECGKSAEFTDRDGFKCYDHSGFKPVDKVAADA